MITTRTFTSEEHLNKKSMKQRIETTEEMMEYLRKCGCKVCGTAEDFHGHKTMSEGIWIAADDSFDDNGFPLFDYYADGFRRFEYYDMGIEKTLVEVVGRKGWYFEWHDAGTMMLYKDM